MKRTNFLIIILLIITATGCSKRLDVQPRNSLTPDQITTSEDVSALVFGAYSTLQNANAFGELYNTATELLFNRGEINWAGTFAEYRDLNEKQQTASNALVYQMWANSYQTINAVNLAISKIDLIEEENRTAVEAEARFLRGLVYFQLVTMYAKPYAWGNTTSNPGVPLVLEPKSGYNPERDKLPRASVAEVYTQILDDLNFAYGNLPESPDNYRASKYAAQALLSRVYLQQGEDSLARDAANDVINSGIELADSYAGAFNNVAGVQEDIFSIQQTSQSNSGTSNFGMIAFYATYPTGRGEIQINEDFFNQFEGSDQRGTFLYEGESISGDSGLFTGKWEEPYRAIPVIRLAEMYLTRAEANARLQESVGATPLEDVNTVRARSGAPLLVGIIDEDRIVEERLAELAFEGEKYLTMKRLKMDISSTIKYDDPQLILPIPEREIDLCNALPQNEGY